MTRTIPTLLLLGAAAFAAAAPGLPLPAAPVRMVIADPAAFDRVLSGGYRAFLTGNAEDGDPVVSAWRKTQVGSKLEDQWSKLSRELPWTWDQIRGLKPTAVGLALLQVGHLEAVLVIDTPLARLPLALPAGTPKAYGGVTYNLVMKGAADGSPDPHRRMGLAWARTGGHLLLATSERALKLALDDLLAGRGFEAPLPGLVALDMDLDALRKDRYFRREFLFAPGPEQGHVHAALRQENGHLVEVREGTGDARPGVFAFETATFATAGWEPAGTPFWPAFRRGLLEPIPAPAELPVHAVAPLPAAGASGPGDDYAVDFTRPLIQAGGPGFEEGDLALWRTLLARVPIPDWGFWVTPDGVRRMAFPWPASADADFLEACRATVARRAGAATIVATDGAQEIRVGPGLPALALRRASAVLWVGPSAEALRNLPALKAEGDLIRWAEVDLPSVRAEAPRWAKAEGPAQPEQVRPLSDRVLGLLGWMPTVQTLRIERRRTAQGWTEKLVFGGGR